MMTAIKNNLKLELEGRGEVTLRPNDYIAAGGEAAIYRLGRTAIKIYHDQKKVTWNNVDGKVSFFKQNPNTYVVAPKGKVLQGNQVIGYYMDFVFRGEHLSSIFNNSFRQRSGFNDEDAKKLVEQIKTIIDYAHQNNALLIDANELGYFVLMSKDAGPEPRMIDVDCWVIDQKWPPTIPIMPSIRDWHVKGRLNKGSDWFAWGIVTFQIFTGIHPFKGKLAGFKPNDIEARMKNNASVFNIGVRLNSAVRDFSLIPPLLLDWYHDTFEKGQRTPPPSVFATGVVATPSITIKRVVTTVTQNLNMEIIYDKKDDPAIYIWPGGIILTDSGKLFDLGKKRTLITLNSKKGMVVRSNGGWLVADIENNEYKFSYINGASLEVSPLEKSFAIDDLFRAQDKLFAVTERGLNEIKVTTIGKKILLSVETNWGVMTKATRWFNGVGVQDALGATFLVLPFGEKSKASIKTPELDNITPVNGQAGNRFVVITGIDKNGQYYRFEFIFDREYKKYQVTKEKVDTTDLNMTILPKGVVARIDDDGELQIMVAITGEVKKVSDKFIKTDMILYNLDDTVLAIRKGRVWSIKSR